VIGVDDSVMVLCDMSRSNDPLVTELPNASMKVNLCGFNAGKMYEYFTVTGARARICARMRIAPFARARDLPCSFSVIFAEAKFFSLLYSLMMAFFSSLVLCARI
jgi:hypothetical protein